MYIYSRLKLRLRGSCDPVFLLEITESKAILVLGNLLKRLECDFKLYNLVLVYSNLISIIIHKADLSYEVPVIRVYVCLGKYILI